MDVHREATACQGGSENENMLQEMLDLSAEKLQRKKFSISPEGILHRVEDDLWMMVAPKVPRQKLP